jgi:hypothetical protein
MTIGSAEQYRQLLSEYAWTLFFWGFWGHTDISDLSAIRRELDQRMAYCRTMLLELEEWVTKSGIRLVHVSDEPEAARPAVMSSPIKTDEMRHFEARMRRIFGLDDNLHMTTQWLESEASNVGIPLEEVRRQLQAAIQQIFEEILTPVEEKAD